jgi:O-acetyl-ADP-ribose deacetylase (regulator of RNase III)
MIELATGDILLADVDAIVNPVNCVGVMGRGLALQFKQRYPENFRAYKAACDRGDVQPGRMFVFESEGSRPRWLINFPTKRHWRDKSLIDDVQQGLVALVAEVRARRIESIGVPPLGCGLGGLEWGDVRPLIEYAFAGTPTCRVLLYASDASLSTASRKPR